MFTVGKPATSESFLGRSQELTNILRFLAARQSFIIKGPHRFGKTSLIKKALTNVKFAHLTIDLRCVSKIDELAVEFTNFAQSYSSKILDANYFDDLQECKKLSVAIAYADSIAKETNTHFIVVVDDIQELERLSCEVDPSSILFHSLLSCKNIISIYVGTTYWSEIFMEKFNLLNQIPVLELKSFNIDEIAISAQMLFNKREITFGFSSSIAELINRLNAHPGNTIAVLRELYYICLENNWQIVSDKMLKEAESRAYTIMMPYLEQCLHEIKGRKHYFQVIQSYAMGERPEIKGPALNQVNKGLREMGYIENIAHGDYAIYDNFLVKLAKECSLHAQLSTKNSLPTVQRQFAQWLSKQSMVDQEIVARCYALGAKHIKAYSQYQGFDFVEPEKSEQLIGFYIKKSGGYGTYHYFFDTRDGNGGQLHPYSNKRAEEILNDLKQFHETEEKFYVIAWV